MDIQPRNLEIPEGNASLMLAWQVKGRNVLVIGAGAVALSRINHLIQADAIITVVASKITEPAISQYYQLGILKVIHEREYTSSDLTMYKQRDLSHLKQKPELSEEDYELIRDVDQNETFALVLAAVDSPTVSSKIYADCKLRGLSVNIADRPPQCDFYFGSVLRKGSLQVMISTNGKSPRLANRIKITKLQPMLDQIDFARAVENLGFLREQVKQHKIQGSDLDTIKRRMEWNKTVTDIYSVEEWGQLTSNDVEKVLDYFPEFPPRSIEELRNG